MTNDQQNQLKKKLLQYRDSLLPSSTAEFIPVGSTGIFFEFGHYQIAQVLQNCDHLFTIVDIVDCVEIWRNVHANNIFNAMSEVFDDMDVSNWLWWKNFPFLPFCPVNCNNNITFIRFSFLVN